MAKESKNNEVYKIEIEIDDLSKEQYESIWAQLVDISGHSGKEITMKGGSAESWDENSGLHKHIVTNRTCSNCHHCVANPVSKNEHDKYKCFAREHIVSISNIEKYVCDKWTPL